MQLDNDGFTAVSWTPDTSLWLTEVPWDSSYRDIVSFDSCEKVLDYCRQKNGMTTQYTHSVPVLPGRPIRLDIPYDQAVRFNYIVSHNEAQIGQWDAGMRSAPRYYMYFITDVRYLSPNSCEIVVQLDVWCTYGVDVKSKMTFGTAMIERGHLPMVLKNRFTRGGMLWMGAPEGLDQGASMQIAKQAAAQIASVGSCSVLVWTSVKIEEDNGTLENPRLKMADGTAMEALPNACCAYVADSVNEWKKALGALRDKPWVTSGIQSVMLVPKKWIAGDYSDVRVGDATLHKIVGSEPRQNSIITVMKDFRYNLDRIFDGTGFEYLDKLRMAPYCQIVITAHNGAPIVLDPQLVHSDDISVTQYVHLALPAPRVMLAARDYGLGWNQKPGDWRNDKGQIIMNWGEDLEVATGFTNFPQFSVLNDGYLNSIASQAHSLAYAQQHAAWQRDMSLQGNQLAYDQSTKSTQNMLANNAVQTGLASQLTGIANSAAWDSTAVNTAVGGIGVLGSALSGNVGGAIQGAAGLAGGVAQTAISTGARSASTSASNAASNSIAGNNAGLANYMRDTNKAYSDMVANGSYDQAIQAINAKIQDAAVTQPTSSGMAGGDAFLLATQGWNLTIQIKIMDAAALQRVGNFWLRYGYRVGLYVDMREYPLQLMKNFTFWKLSDSHIGGDMPETAKQTIRGIFEKGVTVWSDPDKIIPCNIWDNEPKKRDW